jgi:rSAM/selenodomain-associated transferase 2
VLFGKEEQNVAKVSVIIPTLNEAKCLLATLEALSTEAPDEIIVADAKSSDGTLDIVKNFGAIRIAPFCRGRAVQMNAGAAIATGDSLLFLHADTRLPGGGIQMIRALLDQNKEVVGGRFRISFDNSSLKYKLIALYTRLAAFSYGDQSFFVRKTIFDQLNGFDSKVVFEDVDFYKRLRKAGITQILRQKVVTSARRFQKSGFFRQKFINIILTLCVWAGWSNKAYLKRLYPDVR